ncbi:GNAT family N-acetyltransferase [Sinanaerobacter chloroacetimidivorans]|uniref:GNAT family N-acetyltransferase n=1 Tax=Sinanaerobacter chloroacetimidivorans TaxID=2818044 RepID=A0A8J8B285_9FIRM|nr:GNAT family N-acetyltransferase [Sinanaerobacter chloroacetimidivorans]MBR0599019.1 GNAT family N-acetyltransferase [Sinanaerobacter chloroacetimidivorans]
MRKAEHCDLDRIMQIIKGTIEEMNAGGNDQWDDNYPQSKDFARDIENGDLFVEETDGKVEGFICINYEEPEEYNGLNWSSDEKAMVIHRMSVSIDSRKQGIATRLIRYAEELAAAKGITYLKTDTYSFNTKMNGLLAKIGYKRIGEMSFHGKENPFYCYEKFLR